MERANITINGVEYEEVLGGYCRDCAFFEDENAEPCEDTRCWSVEGRWIYKEKK